jgi:hypothetical protein
MLQWNEQIANAILAASEANSALKRLNAEGKNLAQRVEAAVTGGAKVRYLSE